MMTIFADLFTGLASRIVVRGRGAEMNLAAVGVLDLVP
jgi:hypothetical protein